MFMCDSAILIYSSAAIWAKDSQMQLSAAKADELRLEKSRHQVLDSTREARRARTVAWAHAKDASYQAGAF